MSFGADPAALRALVENSGLSFRANGISWIFTCPKCSKPGKLYIRKRDGRYICFHCATTIGYQGRPEFVLADLLHLSVSEAKVKLYGEDGFVHTPGVDLELPPLEDFFGPDDQLGDLLYELAPLREMPMPLGFLEIVDPLAHKGRAYLLDRGIDDQLARKYDLRYSPQDRRVVFPIKAGEATVGWQMRTIEPESWTNEETGETFRVPKIVSSTPLDRNRCLMFQDNLLGSRHAVLSEGPVDAIKADLCGGNVAAMGKSVSNGQIQLILDSPDVESVYLALDPDAAAEKDRLCRAFAGRKVYELLPARGYKDLGAMSLGGVLDQFRAAKRISGGHVFMPPILDPFAD